MSTIATKALAGRDIFCTNDCNAVQPTRFGGFVT